MSALRRLPLNRRDYDEGLFLDREREREREREGGGRKKKGAEKGGGGGTSPGGGRGEGEGDKNHTPAPMAHVSIAFFSPPPPSLSLSLSLSLVIRSRPVGRIQTRPMHATMLPSSSSPRDDKAVHNATAIRSRAPVSGISASPHNYFPSPFPFPRLFPPSLSLYSVPRRTLGIPQCRVRVRGQEPAAPSSTDPSPSSRERAIPRRESMRGWGWAW